MGCSACSDNTQYTAEQGNEECSVCPLGHASNAANTACDDDVCQHPTTLPANSRVNPDDAGACPSSGTMASASVDNLPSQCTLVCSPGYVSTNVQPYLCKADSATTASYDMGQDGSITCTEQRCAIGAIASYDVNAVANTCTENGHLNALTGTITCELGCATGYVVTGTAALACAADGNAAMGARSGGITCTAATCASIEVAYSDKSSGTGTSTTTGTVAVTCNDGYSGSADAVCTADTGAKTAKFAAFPPCAAA